MAQQPSHCRLNRGSWLVCIPTLWQTSAQISLKGLCPSCTALSLSRAKSRWTVVTAQLTYVGFFMGLGSVTIGCRLPGGAAVVNRHLQLTAVQGWKDHRRLRVPVRREGQEPQILASPRPCISLSLETWSKIHLFLLKSSRSFLVLSCCWLMHSDPLKSSSFFCSASARPRFIFMFSSSPEHCSLLWPWLKCILKILDSFSLLSKLQSNAVLQGG